MEELMAFQTRHGETWRLFRMTYGRGDERYVIFRDARPRVETRTAWAALEYAAERIKV
jgi:hypothetical protein